jgi:hypothetical protein
MIRMTTMMMMTILIMNLGRKRNREGEGGSGGLIRTTGMMRIPLRPCQDEQGWSSAVVLEQLNPHPPPPHSQNTFRQPPWRDCDNGVMSDLAIWTEKRWTTIHGMLLETGWKRRRQQGDRGRETVLMRRRRRSDLLVDCL